MSDDLVNRLREGATWDDDIAAADRIEELQAKLAVAVEALEDVNTFGDFGLQHVVRPALAKIKGDKP